MNHLKDILLYVSDNKFMHIIIKDTMKPYKVDVLDASTAVEALKILDNKRVDLILSDIDMPGMDGFQLCSAIRDSTSNQAPFVIFSSSESAEDIEKAYSSGAKGYIIKKYKNDALAKKIMHFL